MDNGRGLVGLCIGFIQKSRFSDISPNSQKRAIQKNNLPIFQKKIPSNKIFWQQYSKHPKDSK